ncbi:MAG: hypothetical protein QXP36_13395 [Conexivisphaerales archaeon]
MFKRSRHLLQNIFFSFLIIFFIGIIIGNSYAQPSNATILGNALGSQFNAAYGSSSGINQRVILPTMSNNVPMTTLNGQTSFKAQMECPNSQAFLQILFEPQSTGDFVAVISQDPTLSGHFTYQATTPLISGVCSNGFISCNAGTWNNCQYYEWTYSNGDVGFTTVADDEVLGSCFCNNSSCGGNFFGQFTAIANTFGAGLASFISENSQMAISNVQSSFPTLTYYGQNAQNCMVVAGNWAGSGYTNPAQYYGDGSALSGAGQDLSVMQLSDSTSPLSLTANNEYMNQNATTEKTCQISHTIAVSTTAAAGCPANSVPSGNMCIPNQTIMSSGWSTNGGGIEYCQVSAGVLECGDQGHGLNCPINLANVLANPPQPYSCYTCSQDWCWTENLAAYNPNTLTSTVGWDFESSHSSAPYVTEPVILGCGQECPSGYMLANGGPSAGVTCLNITQNTNDSCAGQNLTGCQIKNEQVCDQNGNNCVYIYQNYQYIAPSIQPMCYTYQVSGGIIFSLCANGNSITYEDNLANVNANYTACPGYTPYYSQSGTLDTSNNNSDWWIIKKTYSCPAGQMPSIDLQREQMVEQNETYNTSTGVATYPDQGTGYGNYVSAYSDSALQTQWLYTGNTKPCVYSCIVSIPNTPRTAVIEQGAATTNNASTGTPPDSPTIDKTYLACTQDPNTQIWTCPATGGEQVLQPCVCLDQGAQAIAIMSAMVSAGQDMICSQQ